jgi:hypothetical protein
MRTSHISILALFTGLAGCVAAQDDAHDDARQTESAINGLLSFDSSCSPAERTTIAAGMQFLKNALLTNAAKFDTCMRDAFLSYDPVDTPETIAAKMRENKITHVSCHDASTEECGGSTGWAGCASLGISGEDLELDHSFLASATSSSIAGVIAHEVAHTRRIPPRTNTTTRSTNKWARA